MNDKIKVNTLNDVYNAAKKSDQTVYDVKEINFYGGRYKNYLKTINKTLEKGIKESTTSDFYIDLYLYIEKVMALHIAHNIKYKPFIRTWCPTPTSGQHVWFYDSKKQKLEFLWAIPNKVDIISLISQDYVLSVDDNSLIESAMKFFNGDYVKLMNKKNEEVKKRLGLNIN